MLTTIRNRQNQTALNIFNCGRVWLGGLAFAVICSVAFAASLAEAQGFDHTRPNPAVNPIRSQESSILIRDEDSAPPRVVQPVRPSFNIRSQTDTRPLQPSVSPADFGIPNSPTRQDFTNPNADRVTHASLSDRSAAGRTYAQQSRQPTDRFATPQPPSAPIRSSGSTSVPAQFGQTPQPVHEQATIGHNDLRSSNTHSSSSDRGMLPFDRPAQPKFDSMTASPRFVDTRPAPPATMPGTSSGRLNPQLFPPTETPTQQNINTQPNPLLNRQPETTFDDNVEATSFSQAISNETGGGEDLAQKVIDRYSVDNATEPLPGEPMTLKELLQQPLPAQNRSAMVRQYWETWFDWASMQNAIAYQQWLTTVPNASAQGEQGLLDAARSAAENQVLASKIQLGKSQSKLIRFMPTRRSSLSPLPSDSPLVERYETHYKIYKSRNLLPAKLMGIDQMLPQTLTLINSRAQTVQKSQAAIKQNVNGYSRRQVPLASVLETARVWRSSEQDLLASVTSYNQAIADYAFSITRRQTTPEQAVAMLIGSPKAKSAQPPTASRTASSSFGNNNVRNQNVSSQNSRSRNSTAVSFGQPSNNQAATAQSNVASSSTNLSTSANEKLAPTNRPAWNGGNANRSRQPPAVASRRSTADARPSLGTTSRDSFSGTSSNLSSSTPASPTAYSSLATGAVSRPSPPSTRQPTGGFNGRRNLGNRPASNTANGFGGASRTAAPSGTLAAPTRPTAPKPKPFPLPKRPATNNSFGFGG